MEGYYIKTYIFSSVLEAICYKKKIDINILSKVLNIDSYYLKCILNNTKKCNKKLLERILTNISLSDNEIRMLKYSYYIDNETLPRNIIEYLINNNMLEQIENNYYNGSKRLKY